MAEAARPEMTVLMSTLHSMSAIAKTLGHLQSQTVRHVLEVVVVVPSAHELDIDPESFAGFWGYQVVSGGSTFSVARANALGIRQAQGDIVVFTEDHCFPDPGWAEALIAAHREGWTVVGPAFRNANPNTMVSWCDFLVAYAAWMEPTPRAAAPFLPGHNSSYKKQALLDYGDDLEPLLESETVLHCDLARRGHGLLVEPAATVNHVNFSMPAVWLKVQFLSGRVYAATRSRPWGAVRRLGFAAASPLIPLVRLARIVRELCRPGRPRGLAWSVLPTLLTGLAFNGAGQAVGAVAGCGDAIGRLATFEFNRIAYVTGEDRLALAAAPRRTLSRPAGPR